MTRFVRSSPATARSGNVGSTEQWLSVLGGLALLLSAGRGSVLGRIARGGTGLSLLSRAAASYCPMKAAINGQASLGDGYKEQLRRLAGRFGSSARSGGSTDAAQIDSMDAMFAAELQELHSAEAQLCSLIDETVRTISSAELAFRLQEYSTEVRARKVDLESLLARTSTDLREHPDDAMHALIEETRKMTQVRAQAIRDAAITASLQRIIHYKIAGYGTIAAYAKALELTDEAEHFASLAERDRTIDTELSKLAKATLNPTAVVTPQDPTKEPVKEKGATPTRPH